MQTVITSRRTTAKTACCMLAAILLISFRHTASAQDDLSRYLNDSTSQPAHEPVIATFKSDILINGQSNETMHKHDLLFIVAHRFGDIGGSNGGVKTFFGLDNIQDVQIGFEYGISDRFTVGVGRDKGATNGFNINQYQLYYITLKYRLLEQTTDNHIPLAVTLFGRAVISAMASVPDDASDAYFDNAGDRLSAVLQAILARKFSEKFSFELSPTYVRRDRVAVNDMNNMFAMGIGARFRFRPHLAIVADYFLPFWTAAVTDYYEQQYNLHFYNPLGVGLEIETGGHIFHINFTNATSIMENQFIPGTTSSWGKGQFRWGFNLSRTFTLGAHAKKNWKN